MSTMSRHRIDIGGFQPTNTLHAPSLHSSNRLRKPHHTSPPQPRKKRPSTDHVAAEQSQPKRRKNPQNAHHDVEDDSEKLRLAKPWQGQALVDRIRGRPEQNQATENSPETKTRRRASENAFASISSTPPGRVARKALTADYFQNSEYRELEQRMKPGPHPSAKNFRKSERLYPAQPPDCEVFELAPDNSSRRQTSRSIPRESIEHHVPMASNPPNHTKRKTQNDYHQSKASDSLVSQYYRRTMEDSSDELAEDHVSPRISGTEEIPVRHPRAAVFKKQKIQGSQEGRRDFDRIPLMQFQNATDSRGPGVNVSLQISRSDDSTPALVICSDDKPLSFSFDDFDMAIYTQPHSAALLLRHETRRWAYFRFPRLEQLSAFLASRSLIRMEQTEWKPDELQKRLIDLKRSSTKPDHDNAADTSSLASTNRVTSRIKSDRAAEAILPQRERRVKRTRLVENDSNAEHDTRPRTPSSQSRKQHTNASSGQPRQDHDSEAPLPSRFADICRRRKPWKESLIYPRTGRNRATVEWADLERLDDEEFLNDNIISFCLLHIQNTGPGLLLDNRVYFFNTFFYTALTKPIKGQRGINYPAVKSWTKKVDLFSHDYIVVPIHKDLHWYCAIICNVRQLQVDCSASATGRAQTSPKSSRQSSPVPLAKSSGIAENSGTGHESSVVDVDSSNLNEKTSQLSIHDITEGMQTKAKPHMEDASHPESPNTNKKRSKPPRSSSGAQEPLIIILDSLGNSHPEVSRHLKDYLKAESLDKRGVVIDKEPKGLNAKGQPGQHNFSDCGVFMVAYLTRFVEDPARFVEAVVQRDSEFWATMEAHKLRKLYMDVILQTYDWTHSEKSDQRPVKKEKSRAADQKIISDASSSPLEQSASSLEQQERRSSGASDVASLRVPEDRMTLSPDVQVPASDEANVDAESGGG